MIVQREDVLALLSSRACAPTGDEPETLLASAEVIRCADELAKVLEMRTDLPSLVKLQKAEAGRGQGELVVQCLRAYQAHRAQPEKALAAVYEWARTKAPVLYPPVLHTEGDLPGAFARGKAAIAKSKAADLYADCFLVFAEFVAVWNRKQMRVA